MPEWPGNVAYPVWMVRVAEKFRVPLSVLDEWDVEAILDEREVIAYLFDVDNPPAPPRG